MCVEPLAYPNVTLLTLFYKHNELSSLNLPRLPRHRICRNQ